MKSESVIDRQILFELDIRGSKVVRRNRPMLELMGLSIKITPNLVKDYNEYRQEEYNQYREMIQSQITRFDDYLTLDKFSRRLLIQFPADWYDDKPEDYMPCPESFMVQYINEDLYNISINFRSTEFSRYSEDISIIKDLCRKELVLPGVIHEINVHFMNIHKYLDEGSSEDFDVTKGYFDKK